MKDSLKPARYFHGSEIPFEIGQELTSGGKNYELNYKDTDSYSILEEARPAGYLAHKDAVFTVSVLDNVGLSGASEKWYLEVEPQGPVSTHDLNWSAMISFFLQEGFARDSNEVQQAASNYWSGVPHPDENIWEHLSGSAIVIRCEPEENSSRLDSDTNQASGPKSI